MEPETFYEFGYTGQVLDEKGLAIIIRTLDEQSATLDRKIPHELM